MNQLPCIWIGGKVSFTMTAPAHGNHIKPVRSLITKMMVIVYSLVATVRTWQTGCWQHSPTFNLIFNSTRRLRLNLFRWRRSNQLPFATETHTVNTCRGQSISKMIIWIEPSSGSPCFAFSTPLETLGDVVDVFLKGNSKMGGGPLLCSDQVARHRYLRDMILQIIPSKQESRDE